VGCTDTGLWRELEPGTPSPQRRLETCATITAASLPCAVLMGPVVPFLSDSPAQLADTVRQIAAAGATSVTPIVLHLRPGAREWFFGWLGEAHPDLVPRYRALYGRGAYAPAAYQQHVAERVRELAREHGVGRGAPGGRRARPGRFAAPAGRRTETEAAAPPEQLTLL
jgi:DNA repair photolyase